MVSRANAKPGTPVREYIECRHRLHKQGWWTKCRRGDHRAQANTLGMSGDKAKRCVGLEHGISWLSSRFGLHKMVRYKDRIDTRPIGELQDLAKFLCEIVALWP